MTDTIKLAFGIPAYGGQITAYQAQMWLSLGQALVTRLPRFHVVMFGQLDVCGVHKARDRLLAEAMIAEADWLFMVDADTWVEESTDGTSAGGAILRMIDQAAIGGYALASAPVVIRKANLQRSDIDSEYAVYRNREALNRVQLARGISAVDEVGAACLAVNLHAVNAADAHFGADDAVSSDLVFCRRMRANGYRSCVDARVRTGHLSYRFPLYSE